MANASETKSIVEWRHGETVSKQGCCPFTLASNSQR